MVSQLTKSFVAVLIGATGLFGVTNVAAASSPKTSTPTGFDVSFPQCGKSFPTSAAFGIVGVNDGVALSTNPCLAQELSWAQATPNQSPSFYSNTGSPGPAYSPKWPTSQQIPQVCAGANSPECAYDFGWNTAEVSFTNAVNAETTDGAVSPTSAAAQAKWWLDVETGNSWETTESKYGPTRSSDANDQGVLLGAIAYFSSVGANSVGIYSTTSQWTRITGGSGTTFANVPAWIPGFATLGAAESACSMASFGGGPVEMIQYPSGGFDGDYVCGELSAPTNSTTVGGSSTYTDQLALSDGSGALSYTETAGAPGLVVSTSGLVTTDGTLASGSYAASGTTLDPSGVSGTFSFTLSVGVTAPSVPEPAAPLVPTGPKAVSVTGHAAAGKTEILTIRGSGFSGRPRVTSHAGTSALVTKDTGTALDVRVKVAPRSRNGVFQFTITLANDTWCTVKYLQR
jgi:hypothetical protein